MHHPHPPAVPPSALSQQDLMPPTKKVKERCYDKSRGNKQGHLQQSSQQQGASKRSYSAESLLSNDLGSMQNYNYAGTQLQNYHHHLPQNRSHPQQAGTYWSDHSVQFDPPDPFFSDQKKYTFDHYNQAGSSQNQYSLNPLDSPNLFQSIQPIPPTSDSDNNYQQYFRTQRDYSKRDFNQASGGSSQLFQFQNQAFPSSSTAPETVSTVPPPASSNYVNFNLSTICPEINFAVPGSDKVQSKLPSRGVMQHAHPHQDPKVGPANFTSVSSTSEMPPVISQGISLLTPSNPSQLSGINHQAKLPAISTSSLPLATMSSSHTATSTSAAMNFHPQ